MLTKADISQIESQGLSVEEIENQIRKFKVGNIPVQIVAPATIGNGIMSLSKEQIEYFLHKYEDNLEFRNIVKFVPASGASSRMFKDLFSYLEDISKNSAHQVDIINQEHKVKDFFQSIQNFAFYDELEKTMAIDGVNLQRKLKLEHHSIILEYLLTSKGLNYGYLPKALIGFHKQGNKTRKAIDEHLVEGALYAKNGDNTVNIHFTISPEHENLISDYLSTIIPYYEKEYKVKYNINWSFQYSTTDTIAVDSNNNPFRDENGKLLFRPAGHGALIQNLNAIDSDLIFIKNIDNVTTDSLKHNTLLYKKVLAGVLIDFEETIHRNKDILLTKLNRPIRVCGMVKNESEPGGGPFFVKDKNGNISLQIVEKAQIDTTDPQRKEILDKSTHFNPVDIVASIKNYLGNSFDLNQFIDNDSYIISTKSKDGKEIKALELPGLWNGAMSDWNTLFVEVPLSTFSPVKEIQDLLRKEHY